MTPKQLLAIIALPVMLLCSVAVYAQNKTITGKVTDSKDGAPISGASVQPKGTKKGVTTGSDGTFRISVDASVTKLVISSVGYASQEADISSQTDVSVSLTATNSSLNEVVVVGYGTTKRKDLTGSIASVKSKDFNQGIQVSPDQLVQGKVAGVQVINNSGQPGGATTFRIRGNSSLSAGTQPLFVIDGVIVDATTARPGLNVTGLGGTPGGNPLNFINPNDISSIDILKDASATAIYGSRGANGVVIVTTKKGQSGAPKVEANISYGTSSVLREIEVMNASQYRESLQAYGLSGGNFNADVNAFEAITNNAGTVNASLAIGGGNENAKYRISAGYLDQDGVIIGTGFKKLTAGLTSSMKLLKSKKVNLDFILAINNFRKLYC